MVVEDIRLHPNFDPNSTKNYGKPRSMQVITDNGIIETPTRVATNSEILAKSEVPLAMSLPMEICVAFRPLERDVMSSFSQDTSSISLDLIKKTHQFNNLTTRAKLRMSFFQPAEIALENMTLESKLRFARIQAEYLQKRMGYDIVTYPYLRLSSSDYKQFIDQNYQRDQEFTTVFTFDMSMEENSFKEVIMHLLEKSGSKIIALIYRDWQNTVGQHDFIASLHGNAKTIFMACQVEREDKDNHLNKLHEITHNSFDFVALKQNSRGGKLKIDPNKIRIFNPSSKGMDNVINTIQDPSRDIVRELDIPDFNFNDENLITRMVNGYRGIVKSERKFRKWYYLARVHEFVASKREFNVFKTSLLSGTIPQYVNGSNLIASNLIKHIK